LVFYLAKGVDQKVRAPSVPGTKRLHEKLREQKRHCEKKYTPILLVGQLEIGPT